MKPNASEVLFTTITRFRLPASIDLGHVRSGFETVAPRFRQVPGSIRKQFLLATDGTEAGGVYLWNDEQKGRQFLTETVAPMIREKFGVEPEISFYETPLVVE